MKSTLFQRQWLVVIGIFLITAIVTAVIMKARPAVEKKVSEEYIRQVHVTILQPREFSIPVLTQGVVEPRTKIKLLSEVNGKVLETSPKWLNGGFFRKGDTLLSIEDYYYKNQLARARASLAQAKSNLIQEQGFSYVAKQDWEKRNPDEDSSSAKSLALREPQLASMQAQFDAASADVVSAEESLKKTRITAPFDGVIVSKQVDIGQYVSPGLGLAELYAIDVVEIKVPLTEAQQEYLNLPDLNETIKSPAVIKYNTQHGVDTWQGYLVRTEGVLDPVSKVLNGVVQIRDPYGLDNKAKKPLRLGTFVEVELVGKTMKNIFIIPRRFLYAGNVVWLVDAENKLRSRTVKVLPVREENVYVYEGLSAGEKLVSGAIVGLLDGKLVNPVPVNEETSAGK